MNTKDGRKNRKLKIKSSDQIHRRRTRSRTALELPTTDPGSDIHFSTDDELSISDGYCTVPRARRAVTQFDMRRLTNNSNSNNDQQQQHQQQQQTNDINIKMPPELIVTTSANKKKLNLNNLTEFPPITSNKRTNSWHSLNKKCIPKVRVQNINNLTELNNELSLKKKIWTGVSPINNRNDNRNNRPLSWGIPPIQKNKETIAIKDYDPEALLNACSQKLITMQGSDIEYNDSEIEYHQPKNKVTINLSLEMSDSTTIITTPAAVLKKNKNHKTISKMKKQSESSIIVVEPSKQKKKRNSTLKYEESSTTTTKQQLLVKSKGRHSLTRKLSSTTSALSILGSSTTNQIYLAPISKGNQHKFKTSGIVATATIQSNNNNFSNNNSNKKNYNKNNIPTSKLLPTNLQQLQLLKNNNPDCCSSTNLNNNNDQFLKKTKNKIKRKKSKINN